jgi:ribose-phosphate pyrophosphokinase
MKRIYTTEDYRYLRDELIGKLKIAKGRVVRETFPDGEKYKRIEDQIKGDSCYILSGLQTDANFVELLELATFLVENDAKKITMIIPYFGYSTMERATKPGEFVLFGCR